MRARDCDLTPNLALKNRFETIICRATTMILAVLTSRFARNQPEIPALRKGTISL